MKNKFNIFDLFFGIKRKKEKIKEQEKKEKEQKQIRINNHNKDAEYFVDPFITPIPFFDEKNKKIKTKTDEKIDKIDKEEDIVLEEVITPPSYTDNTLIIKNAIIEEVEKNIKEDFYQLKKIKNELEIIQKEEEEKELELEEINQLIIKLQELIKKFEKLKKDFYKKNYDKINDFGLNNKYINDLIQEYKNSLKNNNVATDSLFQIKQIEEYIEIINNLASIEEDSYHLNNNLNDKKEELEIVDKDMNKFEDKYTDIDKITKYVDSFSKEQDSIITEIENKVEQSTKITKTAEYKTDLIIDYSKLLSSTLLMATTAIIPQTKTGNMLKLGLIVAAVANMTKVVKMSTKESKVTTRISKIDYSDSIKSSLVNINDMDTIIHNSLNDIKYMKQSFVNEFEPYKNVIKEYSSMLVKLDSLEKELIVKQQLAKTYETKLNNVLEKNNVKVKRLEEEYKNH